MKQIISWLLLRVYYLFKTIKMVALTLFFSIVFKKFGKGSRINGALTFYCPWNIEIGKYCTINEGALLNANLGKIIIGDHVRISPYAMINTANLDLSSSYKTRGHMGAEVIIEEGVWIGTNAIINPGVSLGKGCVVGAGAVVTHDVEPFTLVAGVPAKKIKALPQTHPGSE